MTAHDGEQVVCYTDMSVCDYVQLFMLFLSCFLCVQVMERLCVRVQQQVCVLKGSEEGEEVQTARQILKEARDSRAVSRIPLYFVILFVCVTFKL